MLTDLQAKQAKGRAKDYKLSDSGGLYLFVAISGRRTWRLKYRHGGKEKRLVLGSYPDMTITAARARRDDVKVILREGKDPALEAKRARLVNESLATETFEKFARQWFAAQKSRWKSVHADDVITSMERDLFPTLGAYPIHQIDEPLLLSALKSVEDRGARETARRLRQRAERVFKYARAHGAAVKSNPAFDVREAMQPLPRQKRWPALMDLTKLRALMRDVDRAGAQPVTRLASRFLALTAQRPGMVRGLPWSEIEGVDWSKPEARSAYALWRIPSARMKLDFEEREDDEYDHLVPLCPEAVAVLHVVRTLTGRGPLAFPNSRDAFEPLSENAIGYLYKGVHVPHGWRSSFSTVMNGRAERAHPGADRLVIDRLIIDLMLAHVPKGMSGEEFTYNRAGYMERRREIFCEWAELLLRDASPVASLLEGRRRSIPR